jgi:hypothetical protein
MQTHWSLSQKCSEKQLNASPAFLNAERQSRALMAVKTAPDGQTEVNSG